MELARSQFGVPLVLEPEYLASPFLDELSGMTYLSYFMKENSPGFRATLRWVNSQLKDKHISNFTVKYYVNMKTLKQLVYNYLSTNKKTYIYCNKFKKIIVLNL